MVHELGSERCEAVRSLSTVEILMKLGVVLSTRGLSVVDLLLPSCNVEFRLVSYIEYFRTTECQQF